MRIAIVCLDKGTSPTSGVDRYCANVMDVLAMSRHDVTLFTNVRSNVPALMHEQDNWRIRTVRLPKLLDNAWVVLGWHLVVLPWRTRSFDAVHIVNGRIGIARRMIVTLHDVAELSINQKYDFLRTAYRRLVLRPVLARVRSLATVSNSARREVATALKRDASTIVVTPNVVARRLAATDATPTAVATFRSRSPFFLYVGRLEHPSKNLLLLIRAMERLQTAGFKAQLLLIGAASWRADIVFNEINRSAARSRIHHLGFQTDADVSVAYSTALCTLLPSWHEGFGIPLIESLSHQTPVLYSSGGALPEVMGTNAGMLAPDRLDDWVTAMSQLLSGDGRRAELLGAQLAGGAVGRHSHEVLQRSLDTLYKAA